MLKERIEAWLAQRPLRQRVLDLLREGETPTYLVGGSVRDLLLGRLTMDLDLAVDGDAMGLARLLADRLRAAYVPLDLSRSVARVVVGRGAGQQHIDLARLRAGDIRADLRARDFTINAMALGINSHGLGDILDPTGGRRDLAAGVLRATSVRAFADDPLRIMRAVRLAGALGFAMTPQTQTWARAAAHSLDRVSPERLRDELMQILALERSAQALRQAAELGALGEVLPGLATDQGALATGIELLGMLDELGPDAKMEAGAAGKGLAGIVQSYAAELWMDWGKRLAAGRARWLMVKLAALLRSLPEPGVQPKEMARRLCLSNNEVGFVAGTVRASRATVLTESACPLDRLAIYRYYRQAGEAGVGGAVLLAAVAISEGERVKQGWRLRRAERLLDAWYRQHDKLVAPAELVSGRDLTQCFSLMPGPQIGHLLHQVREVQVVGQVVTRDQALAYLLSLIEQDAS